MNVTVLTEFYQEPPIREREILRYANCKEADPATESLLREVLREVQDKLTYKVCYCELPLTESGAVCDFGAFQLRSEHLAACLNGCRRAILFAATIGVEPDRLIARYGRVAPAKAVLLQAIGAERIEALCDLFCAAFPNARPRFSPGYGDLPLAAQADLFRILDCERRIGLTLNDSLLMSPTKSVTAILGI